jgi:penicillin-insensitive murein endopeptidase
LIVALCLFTLATAPSLAAESVCRGTTSNGSLENGCQLPADGKNFSSYSHLGQLLGRTYVHCTVAAIVSDAYVAMARDLPGRHFVYGETGLASGGQFKPHKTHQNGLSVDFFVPVLDKKGRSVPIPTHALNRWGYDIEFDGEGRHEQYRIDFEAMASHILALKNAARDHGVGIWRVIFDPQLQPHLRRTKVWPDLAGEVQFSTRRSWVRHDEHYHVDFSVPCEAPP